MSVGLHYYISLPLQFIFSMVINVDTSYFPEHSILSAHILIIHSDPSLGFNTDSSASQRLFGGLWKCHYKDLFVITPVRIYMIRPISPKIYGFSLTIHVYNLGSSEYGAKRET